MSVTFLIPSYLLPMTDGRRQVELTSSARTVSEAFAELWSKYPALRDRIVDEQGQVRQHVNIFVGVDNIRDSGGLAAPLRDGCEIMIVPSVAGGCGHPRGSRGVIDYGSNENVVDKELRNAAKKRTNQRFA